MSERPGCLGCVGGSCPVHNRPAAAAGGLQCHDCKGTGTIRYGAVLGPCGACCGSGLEDLSRWELEPLELEPDDDRALLALMEPDR